MRFLFGKAFAFGISTAVLSLVASTGVQAGNLVVNGDFEITTNGSDQQIDQLTQVTGWTSNGYNFVVAEGSADTSGFTGQYGGLSLWGPNNGSNNGFTYSPTGGNFIAADGAFAQAPIEQTILGLTPGQQYVVSFDWAAAQQFGYDGPNTEQWQVSFGNSSQLTSVFSNADHGFGGWWHEAFTFTANGTSELLSFLAIGTPPGVPPFSLLDGVSVHAAVPEPSSFALSALGVIGLGVVRMRRRSKTAAV